LLNNEKKVTLIGFVSATWVVSVPEKLLKSLKTRASPKAIVYRKVEQAPSPAEDFDLPFGGKLAADNRWVQRRPANSGRQNLKQNMLKTSRQKSVPQRNRFGWR
jgi:hypothetical protein